MAKLFNRAKMDTSTTGSGTIVLGSAVSGYQSFADAGVSNGDVVQYVIEDGANWEIGTGTYSATGTSLTRSPTESSNGGAAISLLGTASVFITAVADDLNRLQNAGSTKIEATASGVDVTGTLTAEDLRVDSSYPIVRITDSDGTNQILDILESNGVAYYTSRNNTSHAGHLFRSWDGTTYLNRINIASNGDTLFYNDTGTESMRWDASSSRLGIGTSSPSQALDVVGNAEINGTLTATSIDASNGLEGDYIGVSNTSNTTGRGISLYGGGSSGLPTYGMAFAGTSTFGTHGSVTGDWATYLTMNSNTGRGWVFKNTTTGNVASISNTGAANFSSVQTTDIRTSNGTQLALSAGESYNYATGQTGERVYLNAEGGVEFNSSADNWASGWAGRNTTTIGKSDGGSDFGGNITIYGGSSSKITFDNSSSSTYDATIENGYDYDGWLRFRDGAGDVRFWFGRDDQVYTGTTQQNRLMRANGDTMSGNLDMGQNDITNGDSIYMDNWYRSSGNTGWYNETYGGGINMVDSTWVRVYNSKRFMVADTSNNSIQTSGGICVDGSGGTRYIFAGPSSTVDGSLYNNTGSSEYGVAMLSAGRIDVARWQNDCMRINRMGNDGVLVYFYGQGTVEGSISVSGTTVSYNGGHLARLSRLADDTKDVGIVKGTVMTNLDEMVVWHHEAQPATYYEEGDDLPMITDATFYVEGDEIPEGMSVGDIKTEAVYAQVGDEKKPAKEAYTEDNEQLNKMAVSSVEGDPNVAGVFVNWDEDDEFNDMNIAMTGDMVIRIAQGTTVARGDLLMSAGDGTAKPQGDDIVRSKTIAKVTSTNVSHTYDDGSYLVPCVLMAC